MEVNTNGNKARKRKNRNRKRNQGKWPNLWNERIFRLQSESSYIGEVEKTNISDPRSDGTTPRVWRHDSMSIESQFEGRVFKDNNICGWSFECTNIKDESYQEQHNELNDIYSPSIFQSISEPELLDSFTDISIETDFTNPTRDNPVRIQDLLMSLDLSEVIPIVESFYLEPNHFRFSPEAVLRTLIYWKLKGYKFLTQVYNDILTDPTLADTLGFGALPVYNQLYHFLNYRLDRVKVKALFDAFLKMILKESEKNGVPIGFEVMTDSSPIPAKKKDPDATYSGHYKMFGYKLHTIRCALTGLPLDYHVSTITEYDGYILPPLLLRLRQNGIEPSKIYMDGAYANFENIARLKLFWHNIEIKCNIAQDWRIYREVNDSYIFKAYNQLWNNPLFQTKPDFEYQQLLLLMTCDDNGTNKCELVGKYYRNKIMKEFYINPKKYLDDYHLRNRIESRHGTEKLLTNLDNINGRGIEKFTNHVGVHLISLMALALCRLQNGVTRGLINLGGLI